MGGITTSQASCNQTVSAYQSPYYDFYVLHLDTFGNIIWQQRYGGSKNDWLNGIIDAGNNEYLLYGRTLSPMSYDVSTNGYNDTSLWMVMIDSAGNKLWDKRYGSCVGFDFLGPTFNEPTYGANTVDGISTSDGGFLFVSNIKDSLPCGDVSEAGKGLEDYWMLKLDHAGYKQWDKRFGGPGRDVAQQVVEMSPGYYIIGGYSKGLNTAERAIGGDKSEITIGVYDIWMVGVVDSEAVVAVHEMEEKSFEFNIYPNPAGDEVTISITPGPSSPVEKGNAKFSVYIYEITGKQQLHQVLPSIALAKDGNTSPPINISTLSSGIYIVEVRDEKGFAERKKLVKD